MSDGRHSTSSLQSSAGVTSAEELSEKYQKLFAEFSKMKAQHSVLKKAVIKEQKTISSLEDECKTKEQELRTSQQQLDLLTFHNQRLTKRIESLQDSTAARLSPGWLVGSAKKELEKSKATLEATSIELNRKIEENEKLHNELLEVNNLYTQHVASLQSKISELEKKTEELQIELTRSHLASEEALSIIRQEKRDLDNELDQTRSELR
ncbi:16581_t:CDS:2, partial [Dentiscutata heterogama]